jgi:ribosomal protein S18 acetylase RimI-like enzyme
MDYTGEITTATRTYLEMNSSDEFKPAYLSDDRIHTVRARNCPASFHRYLYREVGRNYNWVDRLAWTDQEILAYLNNPNLQLWVMYCDGVPAGYFELLEYEDGSTEVAYFGLLPEFIGRGFGKHLLSIAIKRAWETDASRIWLHTCSLDDPAALPNYIKRGFKVFKQETYSTKIQRRPASKARSA